MKKIIVLVVLALAGVATYYFWVTKPKPDNEVAALQKPMQKKPASAFTLSVDTLLDNYYQLSDALVQWDSAGAAAQSIQLQENLDRFHFGKMEGDSLVAQTASPILLQLQQQANTLKNATALTQKRLAFHDLSQTLYDLLRTVRYEGSTVYLQECPMAFNDDGTGNWISKTAAIQNPYLGTIHPKYKGSMLACGETKDSIAYAGIQ